MCVSSGFLPDLFFYILNLVLEDNGRAMRIFYTRIICILSMKINTPTKVSPVCVRHKVHNSYISIVLLLRSINLPPFVAALWGYDGYDGCNIGI